MEITEVYVIYRIWVETGIYQAGAVISDGRVLCCFEADVDLEGEM